MPATARCHSHRAHAALLVLLHVHVCLTTVVRLFGFDRTRGLCTRSAKLIAAAVLLIASALVHAQAAITITPQQCLFRAGDNPSWAAPTLDESGWQPYTQWKLNPDEPRYWVRCHADLSGLRTAEHPAIQVSVSAAYQLYLNGALLGGSGNLTSGFFGLNTMRSFPVSTPVSNSQQMTIAARITYRYSDITLHAAHQAPEAAQPLLINIRAGDSDVVNGVRANAILAQISDPFIYLLCFGVSGVLGLALLGQFLQDRSRLDLLLLSLTSVAAMLINISFFCAPALLKIPVWLNVELFAMGAGVIAYVRTWFYFAAAGRRVPLFFWGLMVLESLRSVLLATGTFLSLSAALRLTTIYDPWVTAVSPIVDVATGLAPFVAFWPFRRIARRTLPVALLCMAWGATMALFFATGSDRWARLFGLSIDVVQRWHLAATGLQVCTTTAMLIALMALLSRDQQRTARERAALAGEMASAREIQQYLIPDKLPSTPGLTIRSVYHPSREVGGDFFQVLPDPRGTLIVVGDVAGKGLKAGMLAALIVGAIRTAFKFTTDPSRILSLLNERLQGRGLVTCMALRIDCNGNAELANAGHLPPYINGRELAVEGALPLGALPDASFPLSRLQLNEGESMLLVSDGVIEARNPAGELFGFERTSAISTQTAEEIARAAQHFGQEDDITVLSLAFSPVEVLHAQARVGSTASQMTHTGQN